MAVRARRPWRFRSVFALFMVLVTVPSLAISGFGIMAIVDARAVAEARLKQSWAQRLRLLAVDAAALLRAPGDEDLHATGADGDPAMAQEALTRHAQAQARKLEALLPSLAQKHFPAELATVVLVHDPLAANPRATAEHYRQTLDDWIQGRAAVADLLRQDVITELRLPPPLDEYRLEARMREDDLLATQVRTTAVLYAVRPDRGYFGLSQPGTIKVDDKGTTTLEAAAAGKHRYLTVNEMQKVKTLEALVELASQPPVVQ